MAISGVTDYTNTYATDRANGSGSPVRNSVRTAGQTSVPDTYRALVASGVFE